LKKLITLIFLGAVLVSCYGCASTVEGVKQDSKDNWETLKRWDQNFRDKWW
jgi:hypothetical protein